MPTVTEGVPDSPADVTIALRTEHLGCTIGGATIVNDVSLSVDDGELLGVIGPNGAGKTSLLNLLSGLLAPSTGRVIFGGRDMTAWTPHQRARAGLGRTFQTSSVFPALSVLENVRIAAQATIGGSLRFWRSNRILRESGRRAAEALDEVGLRASAATLAGALSHGDKRKLELAILLAGGPRIMLLDEPMAGVSAEDVPELSELIRRVHRESRVTMVIVEHHMDVIVALADRLAVMHHGALLVCDRPDAVVANAVVQDAYLGGGL